MRRPTSRDIGMVTGILLTALLIVLFGSALAPVPQQPTAVKQIQSPVELVPVPEDASTVLALKAARTITGVKRLEATTSSSTEGDRGYLESDVRYSTTIYAYPARTDKYVDVKLYAGSDTYTSLRDSTFELAIGDNDWNQIDPATFTQGQKVTQAFVATRYAQNRTTVRSLVFIFGSYTVKVDVANLPASTLMRLGTEVTSGLYELTAKPV